MATQNKIVEMIFTIKTIYPYYAKETDVESLVKTWTLLLQDVPDDVANAAFYKALRVCTVPPTPADIHNQIREMQAAAEPSAEELWNVFYQACMETLRLLPQFEYTYIDHTGKSQGQQAREKVAAIWEGLPERVQQYLGSKGEMMRTAQTLQREDATFEKNRFLKTMPQIAKRVEYSSLLLDQKKNNLIGGKRK